MKISEAFDLYKQNYMELRRYSRRVIEHHDYVKKRFIELIGDKDIKKITIEDISRFANDMEYGKFHGKIIVRSPNSRRCDMQRIKGVFKYLNLTGVKCLNYQLIIVPRYETTHRDFLYEDEVNKMIEHAYSLRNKFIISLFYSSGIRLSELIQLNRDSIQNRHFTVIGKGNKERICFIDERTEILMEEYLKSRRDKSSALIISGLYKERLSPTNVQLIIRNSAKRAGIEKKVTPHVLRHSFATNFIRNNGGVRPLSILLGHSNLNTTMIYTHIEDNELKSYYERFHSVV